MITLQEIFSFVLLASRDAAVLAVAVGVILFLFLRRLPAVWRHLLWMLVVLRLILPNVPESALSWWNWTAKTVAEPGQGAIYPFPDGANRFGPVDFSGIPVERTVVSGPPPVVQQPSTQWTLREILPKVWATGALVWLAVMAAGWFRFQRRITRLKHRRHPKKEKLEGMLATLCAEHGVTRVPGLILTDAVDGPALTGWRRPRILLPGSALEGLSTPQLRMVMFHELGHLRRRDVAVNWALCLLQAVHWFNPVVWWAFRRIRVEAERATDEWVLRRNRRDSPGDYGETLIRLLESTPHGRYAVPGLVGVLESRFSLRSRLVAIRRYRGHSSPWLMATAAVVMLGVGVVGLTQPPAGKESADASQPEPFWGPAERLATSGNLDFGEASQVQLAVKVWRTEEGRPDELIASPAAVTMPGEWVLFEEQNEIHYPTDYNPPILPEDLAAKAKGGGVVGEESEIAWTTNDRSAVLPPHPSGFEKRMLGWSLKLRPDRTEDGKIRVAGVIEQTGLKGFVNWGVPITIDQTSGLFGRTKSRVVTENRQLLPVFLSRHQELRFEPEGDGLVARLVPDIGSQGSEGESFVEGFADSLRSPELPGLRIEVAAKPVSYGEKFEQESDSQVYVTARFIETDVDVSEWWPPGDLVLTDPQFQVAIRALSARVGADLLSAPSLMLDDGGSGRMEIAREFIYPKSYDPPFFPALEAKNGETEVGGFPVAPATPTAFEIVPLGVTLQVMATLLPDRLVELDLSPRISEFREFLNFGGHIHEAVDGNLTGVLVSENEVLAPVFDIRNQRLKVRVPDGQTVFLGGFVKKRELHIEDRLPVIGLIADSKKVVERRYVYMFVTARLIDAAGNPVN